MVKKVVVVFVSLIFWAGKPLFVFCEDAPLIVITASRTPLNYPNTPTNVKIIDQGDIVKSNARNAAEALNLLPSTDVSRIGSLGSLSQARLRGSSADQVLVLIDNRPVGGISLGGVDLSLIPVENIERIEVVSGPGSSIYGANALGGVVNIITKRAKSKMPSTEYTFQTGSFTTQINRLNFDVKKEKLGLFFSASENNSRGFRENGGFLDNHFLANLDYRLNVASQLVFSGAYAQKKTDIPGMNFLPLAEFDGQKERLASTPNTFQKDKDIYGQLTYRLALGEKNMLQSNIYSDVKDILFNQPDGWVEKTLTRERSEGGEVQLNTVAGLSLGGSLHNDYFIFNNQISGEEQINKKAQNYAFFLEDNLHLKNLTIIPGTRYDRNYIFGAQTNPHLSVIYHLSDKMKFSANLGRAYRAPTFFDLYFPRSSFTEGNPDLQPEISRGGDWGTEYKLRENFTTRFTYFYYRVKDMIRWAPEDPNNVWGVWRPFNLDKVTNQGSELEIESQFFTNFITKFNYSYLWSRRFDFTTNRSVLPFYTPVNRFNYQLGYEHHSGWNIFTAVEYVDKQYGSDDKMGLKLPSYTLWDLRLARKIINWDFFAGIDNITDKRYIIRAGYPLPGRSYYAGVTMRFMN